jgi:RNA recognition motif-containing protein
MKSFYRRGQAWVVFDTIDNAKEAVKAMQGFPFVGKPMAR